EAQGFHGRPVVLVEVVAAEYEPGERGARSEVDPVLLHPEVHVFLPRARRRRRKVDGAQRVIALEPGADRGIVRHRAGAERIAEHDHLDALSREPGIVAKARSVGDEVDGWRIRRSLAR